MVNTGVAENGNTCKLTLSSCERTQEFVELIAQDLRRANDLPERALMRYRDQLERTEPSRPCRASLRLRRMSTSGPIWSSGRRFMSRYSASAYASVCSSAGTNGRV